MFIRCVPLCFFVLFVSACSTIPAYVEPAATEASAKFRIKMNESYPYYFFAQRLDEEKCVPKEAIAWVVGGTHPDANRVGMLDSQKPKDGIVERLIPVGNEFSVIPYIMPKAGVADILFINVPGTKEAFGSRHTASCAVPIFVPEAGKQYEMEFRPSPIKCEVNLYVLDASADGSVNRVDIAAAQTRHFIYKFAQPYTCTPKLAAADKK